MTLVTVAVPSYRRPEALRSSLVAVLAQIRELRKGDDEASFRVLVVDNDTSGSAATVARELGADYVCEPEPGLAAVRNRALDSAGDSRVLVFIDDDEVPGDGWLRALLEMYRRTGADAVAGRVTTALPADVDDWTRAGYLRPRRRDGQQMMAAATNNLLLDLGTVRRLGLRFDPEFGLVGGEDTMFTRQLTAGGGVIRWAEGAHVVESIGPERLERRWILTRTFRAGNSTALVNARLRRRGRERLAGRLSDALGGLARIVVGAIRAVWGRASGSPTRTALAERSMWRGAGMLAGAVGYAYDEYRRRRSKAA